MARAETSARRVAVVTQADVARAIRAAQAAGLTIARVVARADGVSIETDAAPVSEALPIGAPRKRIKL